MKLIAIELTLVDIFSFSFIALYNKLFLQQINICKKLYKHLRFSLIFKILNSP